MEPVSVAVLDQGQFDIIALGASREVTFPGTHQQRSGRLSDLAKDVGSRYRFSCPECGATGEPNKQYKGNAELFHGLPFGAARKFPTGRQREIAFP